METTQQFDPVKYKNTTRDQWQTAAEAWFRWSPTLNQWLGKATETMLEYGRHLYQGIVYLMLLLAQVSNL